MPGIIADNNITGHFRLLNVLLEEEPRREFWLSLNFTAPTFQDLGLTDKSPDLEVWQKCQQEQLVLITDNRNAHGPDSLEAVIRALNQPDSLPVITLADSKRFLTDRIYAEQIADRLL